MGIKVNEKTDYGFLFDSLNNNRSGASNNIFNAIDLSEYHSIKSGAYGKALKTYYAQGLDESKETSKTDKDEDKKTKNGNTAVDKLTEVEGNASTLAESTEKLTKYGSDSLFRTKQITVKNEDGTTEKAEGYDVDAIYNAVNDLVKKYNSFAESVEESDNGKVVKAFEDMTEMVAGYKDKLAEVGITIGEDNSLTVSEKDFKAADVADMKSLFNGKASFAAVLSSKAEYIGAVADSEANVMKNYNSAGNYDNMASSMGNLLDSLI